MRGGCSLRASVIISVRFESKKSGVYRGRAGARLLYYFVREAFDAGRAREPRRVVTSLIGLYLILYLENESKMRGAARER